MRLSRVGRTAGVVSLAVIAALLVGAAPASADIIVDSAVCLNGASATLVVHPKAFPSAAQLEWHAVLPQPYCAQANAQVTLKNDNVTTVLKVASNGTTTVTWPFGSGLWRLKVVTSQGTKELATAQVTLSR